MVASSTGIYAEAQKKKSSAACMHKRVEGCRLTACLGFLTPATRKFKNSGELIATYSCTL